MKHWLKDPATNRHIKVLKFFEEFYPDEKFTKGSAGRIIGAIMMSPENRELWQRYVYLTSDVTQDSSELISFEWDELENVVIPEE